MARKFCERWPLTPTLRLPLTDLWTSSRTSFLSSSLTASTTLWGKQLPYLPDHRLVTQYAKDDKTLEVVVHLFASKAHTHIKDTKLTLGFMENVADLPGTIIIPTLHTMLRATSWLAAPLSVVPPNTEYDPAFAQLDFNIFGQPFWEVVKEKYEEFLGPHFISFATPRPFAPKLCALERRAPVFSRPTSQDPSVHRQPGTWRVGFADLRAPVRYATRRASGVSLRGHSHDRRLIDPGFLMEVHGNSGYEYRLEDVARWIATYPPEGCTSPADLVKDDCSDAILEGVSPLVSISLRVLKPIFCGSSNLFGKPLQIRRVVLRSMNTVLVEWTKQKSPPQSDGTPSLLDGCPCHFHRSLR
ncbi:hypothetical protein CC2G_006684 [Coprinopsis cinerea AmutBmut pab1-1]|nr:hypothetical protein CC2G_006684 [Coprinopsis cinerea AmutBmut pab1-1]